MRAKKNILNDVRGIGPDDMELLKEVWSYAIKNDSDVQAEFWDEIPDKRMASLPDDMRAYMNEGPEEGDPNDPVQGRQDFIDEFIDPHFKISHEKRGAVYYSVTDADNKVLEEIPNGYDLVIQHKAISTAERVRDKLIDENFVKSCVNRWCSATSRVTNVEPFRMPDEPGWTRFRPRYKPDYTKCDPESLPSWMGVLDRMSDPDAFLCWIWGVYSGNYGGRKVLWLYGGAGEEGKSTISSLLGEELFGPSQHTIDNSAINAGNKNFLNSHFEGARLILYPDCNVPNLIMHENFKSIASGGADKLFIEHKGKTAYNATVKAYAWVCSNVMPTITDDGFVSSRTLLIKIEPFKGDPVPHKEAKRGLRTELNGLLAMAQITYEELCPDNYEIAVNDATRALESSQIIDSNDEFDTIFSTYFVANVDGKITTGDMRKILKKEGLNQWQIKDFHKYLYKRCGSEQKRGGTKDYWIGVSKRGASNVVQLKSAKAEKVKADEVF